MTDAFPRPEPAVEPESKLPVQITAGALIRQAREASGLHIAALAVSLKVSVKKLEALEADQFGGLHDAVFVRALAAAVCRSLRIDPAPVLERLPQSVNPVLVSEPSVNTPFHSGDRVNGLPFGARLRHPLVLAVLALLFAAAIVAFLPELQKITDGNWLSHPDVRVAAPVATIPVVVTSAQTPVTPASEATSEAAPAMVLENVSREPVPAASAAPGAVVPTIAAGPVQTASKPDAVASPRIEPTANALLAFKARASSWIEVTDARGVVVLRRILPTGETAAVSGSPPLQTVIGRADAVEVLVRGKPFDLTAVSKENVARFEVK